MINTQVNNGSVKHYVKLLRKDKESLIQEIKGCIVKLNMHLNQLNYYIDRWLNHFLI